MPRKPQHTASVVEQATLATQSAATVQDLRRAQSIVLPALFGATLEQTAMALGVSRATVSRLQAAFRQAQSPSAKAGPARSTWGGRRHCWMTLPQEKEFLAPWLERAAQGHLVMVGPVWAALEQHLGRPVKASVVYRMLARHGWRKVAPDSRHPKSDPAVQQDWKKNSRRIWQPC